MALTTKPAKRIERQVERLERRARTKLGDRIRALATSVDRRREPDPDVIEISEQAIDVAKLMQGTRLKDGPFSLSFDDDGGRKLYLRFTPSADTESETEWYVTFNRVSKTDPHGYLLMTDKVSHILVDDLDERSPSIAVVLDAIAEASGTI